MAKTLVEHCREIGRKGGANGSGSKKRRGDASYYQRLSELALEARRAPNKGIEPKINGKSLAQA